MAIVTPKIKAVSALVVGMQAIQPVMAHNGELHGQEEETSEDIKPNTAGPDPIDSSAYVPDDNAEAITTESATVSDAAEPLSTATFLDGFSVGFGEILFGLVLIFPWLLITLRKQLHLSSRS